MSTSGQGGVNAVLYIATLALALPVGLELLGGRRPRATFTAVGLWLAVAVPSLLQMPLPVLLRALRRDPELVRHHGQVWRLLTSVVVQDGGVAGTVFNLAVLAVVVIVAAELWGPVGTPALFVTAQLVFAVPTVFLSDDIGAGNSGATFAVATSLVGAGLAVHRTRPTVARAVAVLGAGAALLAIGDAHGIPVLGGLVLGLGFAAARPPSVPAGRHDNGPDVANG